MTALSNKSHLIRRRLCVDVTGSLQQFAKSGPDAALWAPNNAKIGEILGVSDVFDNIPDVGLTAACLQNAVLHKVVCLEHKNDFPIHLGVSLSCIPSDETTRHGNKFAVTAFAKTHNPFPITLFEAEAGSNEATQWREMYPAYNTGNLEKEGVMELSHQNYLFMSKNHPVVEILRSNKDLLNADIDKQQLIDNEWYKITRQVFNTCCSALRSKILTKVATRDLNNFSVQVHRLHHKEWSSILNSNDLLNTIPPEILATDNAETITNYIKQLSRQQHSINMRLELTYEIQTRV